MRFIVWLFVIFLVPFPVSASDVFDAARNGDIKELAAYEQVQGEWAARNSRGYTPFILTTYYGHAEAAKTLVGFGADPCAVDYKGDNAYMGVAFKGHVEVAKWMLGDTQCDINHRNYAGQTALMMASLFGHEEMVALLLKHKADPRIKDNRGNTAESLAKGQGLSRVLDIIRFNFFDK